MATTGYLTVTQVNSTPADPATGAGASVAYYLVVLDDSTDRVTFQSLGSAPFDADDNAEAVKQSMIDSAKALASDSSMKVEIIP